MRCERSLLLALLRCWERRIGFRLDFDLGRFDPVKEITRRLYPNDQREARLRPLTSNRSLAWPLTPDYGFRLPPTRESLS